MAGAADSEPGFTVPGYSDVRRIGHGGFSTVYYAVQTQYERGVALKVMEVGFDDERSRRQFQRECAAMGRLSGHPNIVTILDSGFTSGHQPYLAMDFCSQGSLGDQLVAQGPLTVADVLRIGVKISGALESAHRKDILHRDLKPENLLVNAYGEPGLTDFGIATVTARLESSVTMHALTPSHAPPEVLEGKKNTERSDVYSLGSTLYALLAGRPAFSVGVEPSILSFLLRVIDEPVPPIPRADVPQVVQDVLIAAMAKDPAYRYQSAAALGQALQQLQRHLGYPVTEMVTVLTDVPIVSASIAPPHGAAAPLQPAPPPTAMTGAATEEPLAWGVGPPTPAAAPGRVVAPGSFPPGPPAVATGIPAAPSFDPASVPPGDSTVLRPGTESTATAGSSGGGAPSGGSDRAVFAPPAPPAISGVPGADLGGGATVLHERHAPIIEPADLTPPAPDAKSPLGLRIAGVILAIALVGGVGYFGYTKVKGSDTVASTTGPATSTTVVAGGPADPGAGVSTTAGVTTSSVGSVTDPSTTAAGGTAAGGPPENVSVKVVGVDSLQVTWTDPSGGKLPFVYQVLSPQGKPLSKINVATEKTSAVVTQTDSGPLTTASQTYCVAVGSITGAGKPAWAPAPCTDGSKIDVT